MNITDDQAEKALDYLKATDEECAGLKSNVEYLDEMRKIIRAQQFLEFDGNIGVREKQAIATPQYWDAVLALKAGTEQYETMRNRRFTANQQIEVWRSTNANRRKGNI